MNLIKNLFHARAQIYERSLKLQLILALLKFLGSQFYSPKPGNDEHATDSARKIEIFMASIIILRVSFVASPRHFPPRMSRENEKGKRKI
jgi:hypothetical protein